MQRPKKQPAPEADVYGLMLLVRVRKEPQGEPEVLCPKCGALFYGEVVSTGDGFDTDAKAFRKMPVAGAVVTFEDNGEHIEGHYFYQGDHEYRVIHLDTVIVAFPQTDGTETKD